MNLKMLQQQLMAPDGDNDGGGGGGDGGLTDAQREEMTRLSNAANSAHHTRIQKVLDTKLASMRDEIMSSVNEAVATLKGKADDGKGKGDDKTGNADVDAAIARVKAEADAKLKALGAELSEQKTAREEAAAKAKRTEERNALTTALTKAGVEPSRLRAAVALLYTEDERVGRDDDDKVVFLDPQEGYVDKLPLGKGVKAWLESDEGKAFAAAKDAGGSGAQGGRRRQGGGQKGKRTVREKRDRLAKAVMEAESTGQFT